MDYYEKKSLVIIKKKLKNKNYQQKFKILSSCYHLVNVEGAEMNVSHAGDLTVLAAHLVRQEDAAANTPMLGIDVMPVKDR